MQQSNITYFFSSVILAASSSTFAENIALDNNIQRFDNHILTLSNDSSKCELITTTNENEARFSLALSAPCYWVTKPESVVAQHYSYPEKNISHALLIAGTALDWDNEKKKYHKLPLDTYCSQYLQTINIIDGAVTASKEAMDAPNCIGQAVDEKVFHGTVASSTAPEPQNEEGLFESIKKTFKQLFQAED